MAKYAISKEGAASLNQLANDLLIHANYIIETNQILEQITSALYDNLGIYGDEIISIIHRNRQTLNTNREDIVDLAQRVKKQATDVESLVAIGLGDLMSNASSGENAQNTSMNYASQLDGPRVLRRDEHEAIESGMRAIDDQMDALRDDLYDKGYTDKTQIESIISHKREETEIEFYNDLYGTVDNNALASLQRLSSYFLQDCWNGLSIDERQDALNTLAIDAGNAYRSEIKGVIFFDADPSSRGYYNGDGYLYINSDCLTDNSNRLDAIDTIYHEGRHAFQHAAIMEPSTHGITTEQAAIWEENFNHYLSSSKFGYERYYNQPVENDAFSYAEYIIQNGGIT